MPVCAEQRAHDSSVHGQHKFPREQLAKDALPRRADRSPNRKLALALCRPDHQKSGEVRTRDQEHAADGSHQDEQRLSHIADNAIQLRPEIDTLLFLRPTENALVFLQQLGRGLRLADGKDCVTVLDFIGEANRRFRFDLQYRAVTGATRTEVARQIAQGFPFLPAGWQRSFASDPSLPHHPARRTVGHALRARLPPASVAPLVGHMPGIGNA
jgi:hypothetical protein